jgi:hypothetical protein
MFKLLSETDAGLQVKHLLLLSVLTKTGIIIQLSMKVSHMELRRKQT